jgi:hypothetical protein
MTAFHRNDTYRSVSIEGPDCGESGHLTIVEGIIDRIYGCLGIGKRERAAWLGPVNQARASFAVERKTDIFEQ